MAYLAVMPFKPRHIASGRQRAGIERQVGAAVDPTPSARSVFVDKSLASASSSSNPYAAVLEPSPDPRRMRPILSLRGCVTSQSGGCSSVTTRYRDKNPPAQHRSCPQRLLVTRGRFRCQRVHRPGRARRRFTARPPGAQTGVVRSFRATPGLQHRSPRRPHRRSTPRLRRYGCPERCCAYSCVR
jgi:hypothetical protein